MSVSICLIQYGSPDRVTLVELSALPEVNEQKMISPAEVRHGPQPVGQTLALYNPARTLIRITKDLGTQWHFGNEYPTFEYVRSSLNRLPYTRGAEVLLFLPALHEEGLASRHIKCVVLEGDIQGQRTSELRSRYVLQTREAASEWDIHDGQTLKDVIPELMRLV